MLPHRFSRIKKTSLYSRQIIAYHTFLHLSPIAILIFFHRQCSTILRIYSREIHTIWFFSFKSLLLGGRSFAAATVRTSNFRNVIVQFSFQLFFTFLDLFIQIRQTSFKRSHCTIIVSIIVSFTNLLLILSYLLYDIQTCACDGKRHPCRANPRRNRRNSRDHSRANGSRCRNFEPRFSRRRSSSLIEYIRCARDDVNDSLPSLYKDLLLSGQSAPARTQQLKIAINSTRHRMHIVRSKSIPRGTRHGIAVVLY